LGLLGKGAGQVDTETTTAEALRITQAKAKYDEACKRILSEKPILARLMKECLEEYRDCDVNDIAEKYIEGTPQVSEIPVMPDDVRPVITGMDTADKSLHEGTITYDIRFYALVPGEGRQSMVLIVNVEAQGDFNPGYPILMRGIFYCCRMISSQYGREFTNAHYEKIKKVCSLWICMNPPKYRRNTITRYRLTEEQMVGHASEPVRHYDLMTIIMICLGGPEEDHYTGILRMLGVLLSNHHSETEKRQILQDEYALAMTQTIEREVSQMCNISNYVERQAMERGMAKGMAKGMAEGMEKGIAKGMEKGVLQGRTEGLEKGVLLSLKSLMGKLGFSAEQAMTTLSVPESEWPKYQKMLLEQQ